jgi:hypothetical protein
MAKRRPAKDLAVEAYAGALDGIAELKHPFVYIPMDFKRAPNWSRASTFRRYVDGIITVAEGCNVTQKSIEAAIVSSFAAAQIEPPDMANVEKSGYVLRAIVSQMANHKRQDRAIPREWLARFATIFAKIQCGGASADGSDATDRANPALASLLKPTDAAEEVEPIPSSAEVIDSDSDVGADVLRSDNPELQRLLTLGTQDAVETAATAVPMPKSQRAIADPMPKRRVRKKTSGIDGPWDDLIDETGPPLNGKAWLALTMEKKKEHVDQKKAMKKPSADKGKNTNSKKAKAAKGKKAEGAKPSWKVFSNREHSKAWHAERVSATSMGFSDAIAKSRAKAASFAVMTKLRAQYTAGELDHLLAAKKPEGDGKEDADEGEDID